MADSVVSPLPFDGERPPIIGGETPFFSPSDVPRVRADIRDVTGIDHKPLGIEIDGKDQTRLIKLVLCAMTYNAIHGLDPRLPMENMGDPDEFLREFVAGANTDLMAMGKGPLISLTEVKEWAPGVLEWGKKNG